MSKGTLEFNLPEENEEFKLAQDGVKYMLVLHELDNHLRAKVKYAPDSEPREKIDTYQEIRDKLWELANNESVEF